TIPGEPLSPFITSGLRIGTPAVTTRGFKESEMVQIAAFISDIITDFDANRDRVTEEVKALCAKYPIYA
ncbi:MAG: serine hydroxymethyltransferase, partial [Clostridia bacterium]|nr:serine hydroxymethyltransferase [Clostridia bacterium]